jgi:hypothetical protein
VDLGRSRNQKRRRSVSISTSPARSFLATCVARSTLSRGILRALAAFYPEPKYRTCNPQDRIDIAMGIAMITEVIAQPLDRCDQDPIQPVCSEYRQNMFGESCSKVRDVGGTAVGLALKPILSDLRERRYLSRGDVVAKRRLVCCFGQKPFGRLARFKTKALPRPARAQRPIIKAPAAGAIASGALRQVEFFDSRHRSNRGHS